MTKALFCLFSAGFVLSLSTTAIAGETIRAAPASRVPGDDSMPIPICELVPEVCIPGFRTKNTYWNQVGAELGVASTTSERSNVPRPWISFGQPSVVTEGAWHIVDPKHAYWGNGYLWMIHPDVADPSTVIGNADQPDSEKEIIPICRILPICDKSADDFASLTFEPGTEDAVHTDIWDNFPKGQSSLLALPYANAFITKNLIMVPAGTQIWKKMVQE